MNPVDSMQGIHRDEHIIALTREWVEQAVIGLNLCPFANSVFRKNQIAFQVSHAQTTDALWQDLLAASETMLSTPADQMDTLLLIHPWALGDFFEFNDFVGDVEALFDANGLSGVLQVASFHPDYQFADATANDPTNHTNHSPFPTLHLLREASLDKAIDSVQNTESIVDNNLETMRRLGHAGWDEIQARIRRDASR